MVLSKLIIRRSYIKYIGIQPSYNIYNDEKVITTTRMNR